MRVVRAYAAAARNLEPADDTILPDDACGPAERVAAVRSAPR